MSPRLAIYIYIYIHVRYGWSSFDLMLFTNAHNLDICILVKVSLDNCFFKLFIISTLTLPYDACSFLCLVNRGVKHIEQCCCLN